MTVSGPPTGFERMSPADARAAASAKDRPPDRSAPKRAKRTPAPRRSLRKQIDQLVTLLNMPLVIVAPRDALDPVEQGALVEAIDQQAQSSPRFHKALESLLSVTAGGSLPIVAGIIVARRAARHGAFGAAGAFVDGMGGQALAMANATPSEAAAAMQDIADMMSGVKHDTPDNGKPADAAGAV